MSCFQTDAWFICGRVLVLVMLRIVTRMARNATASLGLMTLVSVSTVGQWDGGWGKHCKDSDWAGDGGWGWVGGCGVVELGLLTETSCAFSPLARKSKSTNTEPTSDVSCRVVCVLNNFFCKIVILSIFVQFCLVLNFTEASQIVRIHSWGCGGTRWYVYQVNISDKDSMTGLQATLRPVHLLMTLIFRAECWVGTSLQAICSMQTHNKMICDDIN